MDPEIIQQMHAYQRRLLEIEEAAQAAFADRWVGVERRLEAQLELLARALADEAAAGALPTADQIRMTERYRRLLDQLQAEFDDFSDYAAGQISRAQVEAVRLGADSVGVWLAGQPGPVVSVTRLPALERMVGLVGDGSPLPAYFRSRYPGTVDGVMEILLRGMALGWNPMKTARAMRDEGLALLPQTAIRTARTETMRAYRAAALDRMRADERVFGYYWLATKSVRTCPACLSLDGTFWPKDVPHRGHVQCRCTMVPGVQGRPAPKWETGPEWFETIPESDQRLVLEHLYDPFKKGEIGWEDVRYLHADHTWGDSWQVASVSRATRSAQARMINVASPVV